MGAAWLIYKTEGELQRKAVRLLRGALVFTVFGMVAVSLATPLASARIFEKWFAWPEIAWLAPLPVVTGLAFLWLWRLSARLPAAGDRHALVPFLSLAAIFALGFAGLAYSFYPYVVPDRLTIWQAAAATRKPRHHPGRHRLRPAGDHRLFVLCLPDFRRQSG